MFGLLKRKITKTSTVFEMEELGSGAAALAMILRYYEIYIPLVQLRIEYGIPRDGLDISHLINIAQKYGLKAELATITVNELKSVNFPCISMSSVNHYYVIEGVENDSVFINDPATGSREISLDEFSNLYNNKILWFEKNNNFKTFGQPFSHIKSLLDIVVNYKWPICLAMLCGVFSFVIAVMMPIFTKLFIDYYYLLKMPSLLEPILLGVLTVLFLNAALRWMQKNISLKIYNKLAICQTSEYILKLFQLPFGYYFQKQSGDIAFGVSLNEFISLNFSQIALNLFIDSIAIVFFGAMMLMFDVQLTLIIFAIAFINVIILVQMTRSRSSYGKLLIANLSKYKGLATSSIGVMPSIKASGWERDLFTSIAGAYTNVSNVAQELDLTTNSLRILPNVIMGIILAAIIIIGSLKVMNYSMTLGTFLAMQSLSVSFLLPLNALVENVGKIQDMFGALGKVKDVKDYSDVSDVDKCQEEFSIKESLIDDEAPFKGKITIQDLYFGYNINTEPVLKGINLTIAPGERVAIIGASGSGKSTLTKLMMRIYKPWQGNILYDDKPIEVSDSLIKTNAIVLLEQEPFIFKGSIRDNISMWDRTCSEDQIIAVTKLASFHEDVIALKNGYEELLQEDGNNISGGQRQKLEIARGLLCLPKIVIFDDATSNIDAIVERKIMDNILRLGCTVLVISHRLSTIKYCDRVLVLEDGQIVQEGTHSQLFEQEGSYRTIVKEHYS